ncbi:MAG: hypothetical protein DWB99_03130 [Candidatus Poseidoniales archaeon]|nr:MAG: hypothetical protein DWB99_03130 [Candidatus Poseidoniales archaeon]
MSMLNNSKMMLGAALALLVLSAPLSMMSTAGVEAAVEENFETFTKDNACANDDCTEAESDWASSTSQRDYYAWNITNVDDVMATNAAPMYQKVGPFTYDITHTRTIVDYNESAGTMTYNQVKSFECAEDSEVSCDTPVSQLNIAFRAQTIGATGLAVNGIMEATKAGFAVGMMGQDLNTTQAGVATAADIAADTSSDSGQAFGTNAYLTWAAMNPVDALTLPAADFSQGIETALSGTMHPFDANFNISLLQPLGSVAFLGLGDPEDDWIAVASDPLNSTTMQRATTYGYVAPMMIDHDADSGTPDIVVMMDLDGDGTDDEVPDFNQTLVRDKALHTKVGLIFSAPALLGGHSGNSDVDPSDNDGSADRMENLLGVSFDGVNVTNLLTAGHLTDNPTGLIATNAAGTGFGIATFLGLDAGTAMSTYGLTMEQYGATAGWAAGWVTSVTSVQLGLLGGIGTMNAAQFVNITFGGEDPINGGYLTNSLNMGGLWGTALTGSSGAPAVDLDPALAGNILYGDLGLTTSTGAGLFLYGELSGMTPPIDFTTMGPGTPMTWNTSTISMLYGGIDANTIGALRTLMMGPIFGDFVPGFLQDSFGSTPYLTQSVSSWLFGWHDPVSAFLASGNPMDMSVGWSSLETNETYYGSDEIANGDGTNYTVCTGESSSCDLGETLLEDGSPELPWRSTEMMMATFGLVSVEYLNGTTGGFLTGSGDKVDVSGYAIADITCSGTSEVKNIPVDTCSASVDPLNRLIQAKLLGVGAGLVAATPSALPVYLGSDISMSSEELSGLIIAGESTTTFYLDTRDASLMTTTPTMDNLTKVFEIKSSSMIDDDDAEDMESAIVQNQNGLSYWTNFDVPTDYIALLLYLGAVACLVLAAVAMNKEEE